MQLALRHKYSNTSNYQQQQHCHQQPVLCQQLHSHEQQQVGHQSRDYLGWSLPPHYCQPWRRDLAPAAGRVCQSSGQAPAAFGRWMNRRSRSRSRPAAQRFPRAHCHRTAISCHQLYRQVSGSGCCVGTVTWRASRTVTRICSAVRRWRKLMRLGAAPTRRQMASC